MTEIVRWAGLIALLAVAPHLHATDPADTTEPKLYDVEVIIFKNLKVPKSHEFNLPTPSASRQPNTIDLSSPASIEQAADHGVIPLPTEQLRLQDSVGHIVRSSRYELLLHTGWRQPGLDEDNAIPVWIRGGKIFDNRYSSIDQVMEIPAAIPGRSDSAAPTVNRNALYELEGQLTITLSRYLHTRAELVLRKPVNPDNLPVINGDMASGATDPVTSAEQLALEGQLLLNYALNEQRRMRSRKLHYLDHPEFGMLVMITPYEAPDPAEENPGSNASPLPTDGAATESG